ncbi:MAG: sigma-70 family RNA polymerase sigma factor [Acidimicrobiales bacterium]
MTADRIDPRFFELAETGDIELRNELVVQNQGLAIAFARRYRDRGVPDEDLDQIAFEALVRAVDRFDPHRGLRFSTFAARTIEGELKQYFRDRTWAVHVPRRTRQLTGAVRSAGESLSQRLGRAPTPAEIAAELGLDLADVTLAFEASAAYRSEPMDAVAGDDPQPSLAGEFDTVEARVLMPRLLESLAADDRVVVELRFFDGLTQSQIAARIGVSQMQVSRIMRRALAQLRGAMGDGD